MGAIAIAIPETPATPAGAAAPPSVASVPAAAPPAPASSATGGDSAAPAEATPEAAAAEKSKLQRAKEAGERARADADRRRARVAAEEKQRSEAAQLRAENERLTRETADVRTARDEALPLADRHAAMRRLGWSAKQVVEATMREGSPEAQLEALLDKRVGPVMTELEQLRAWKAQQEQALQQQQRAQGSQALIRMVSDAATFPNLAKHPPSIIIAAAQQKYASLSDEQKAQITDHDVFEFLEDQYAAHTTAAASSTLPTTATDTPTVSTPNEKAGSTTPRTISAALAPPRPSLPPNWDAMDVTDQKTWMAQQIKAQRKK